MEGEGMTTVYEKSPTLEERLHSSPLIVRGRVQPHPETQVDDGGDTPQVQTVFRVDVEEVLKGDHPGDEIMVRVVGGSDEGIETPSTTDLVEGERALLLLAPDHGPERPSNAFVPYFGSCFCERENRIQLPGELTEEVSAFGLEEHGEIPVAALRHLLEKVAATEVAEEAGGEPPEVRETEAQAGVEVEVPPSTRGRPVNSAPLDGDQYDR